MRQLVLPHVMHGQRIRCTGERLAHGPGESLWIRGHPLRLARAGAQRARRRSS